MTAFEKLGLSEQLMSAINKLGFKEPTQIQRETIPLILEGKDVIGGSATGSGKTLAFAAGIIERCVPKKGVQAIVIVPTRELAEQVKDEIIELSYKKPLKILAVYGGVSINPQINYLRRTDVVVATPGRLLDHLSRKTINTSKVKIIVLDEADRMVEMGFIEDVERIIRACPNDRQTMLFSATMHGLAKKIAKKYMNDPETVHAEKMVDPSKLKQAYYDVPSKLKKALLIHLLQKEKSDLVMVFCNTRRETDMLVEVLKNNKIKAASIHGGLNQAKRLNTIDMFHRGKFQVLVCTDVAARGLHIEGITHIYNFDIPKEPGDYVHRIGRTARVGKSGLVINILSNRDHGSFSRLIRTYREFDIKREEAPHIKIDIVDKREKDSPEKWGDSQNKKSYRGENTGGFKRSSSRGPNRDRKSSSRNTHRNRKPSSKKSDKFGKSYSKTNGNFSSKNSEGHRKPLSKKWNASSKQKTHQRKNTGDFGKSSSGNSEGYKKSFSENTGGFKKSKGDDENKKSSSRSDDKNKFPPKNNNKFRKFSSKNSRLKPKRNVRKRKSHGSGRSRK